MDPTGEAHLKGYSKTFDQHGESPKALQWQNYKSATLRYKQILSDLEPENTSILDVGCGMGDILPFIYAKATNFRYLGVDRNASFIDVANKRYEGHEFRVFDPFKDDLGQTFDIVILCGALNANKPGWMENRQQKIKKLFSLANTAVVFNMAGSLHHMEPDSRVAYADAQEITEFCAKLSPKIVVKTHYHPKDFTVVLFK
jgi:SAM-dependent methyltransferase